VHKRRQIQHTAYDIHSTTTDVEISTFLPSQLDGHTDTRIEAIIASAVLIPSGDDNIGGAYKYAIDSFSKRIPSNSVFKSDCSRVSQNNDSICIIDTHNHLQAVVTGAAGKETGLGECMIGFSSSAGNNSIYHAPFPSRIKAQGQVASQ
jgi:hypothetical protein